MSTIFIMLANMVILTLLALKVIGEIEKVHIEISKVKEVVTDIRKSTFRFENSVCKTAVNTDAILYFLQDNPPELIHLVDVPDLTYYLLNGIRYLKVLETAHNIRVFQFKEGETPVVMSFEKDTSVEVIEWKQ